MGRWVAGFHASLAGLGVGNWDNIEEGREERGQREILGVGHGWRREGFPIEAFALA